MKLRLLVVGKLKDRGLRDHEAAFALRMRAPLPLEIREFKSSEAMQSKLTAPTVMLDERGEQITSRELSDWISAYRDAGTARLNFAIGDGARVLQTSKRSPSIEGDGPCPRLTLPHRLARILMVETTVPREHDPRGHPYHHE